MAITFAGFAGIVLIWPGMKGVTIATTQTYAVMRIPMTWVYLAARQRVLMIVYATLHLADLAQGRARHPDTLA